MGLDFAVAITPSVTGIDKELKYVKSALLYADNVTLISPLAYLFTQLSTNGLMVDERKILRIMNLIIPFCEEHDPEGIAKLRENVNQFNALVCSKKYKAVPMVQKLTIRQGITEAAALVDSKFCELLGQEQTNELCTLLKSKKLKLQRFEHSLTDTDGCVIEFFKILRQSVRDSYPLFDELSNNLMVSAMNAHIIQFNDTERKKITHAGVSDNLIQRLPSFELATVDEILDIRKELDPQLIRYRAKVLSYSDSIQSLPWDDSFEYECTELYYKEVAPAVEEIAELTAENSFLKNLGYAALSNGDFLKSAGGLVCSVAAGGVIGAFNNAVATDKAVLASGGVWAVTKVAESYREYKKKKKEIQQKDLYFYYQAGKLLNK